ncbi:MAG: cytochrome P450 [Beijerinckiaceae bacterium]
MNSPVLQRSGQGAPGRFVPYRTTTRVKPLSRFEQLARLASNPIESWIRPHFEMPVVAGPSLVGETALINDPAGIRRVLLDNVANYEKDPLQMRVLSAGNRAGAGQGLLVATGDLWKRTRRTLAPLFAPRRVAALARVMHVRAEQRVDRWLKRRPGAILEIDREMTGVTYDILSATMFSDALDAEAAGFEKELGILLDNIGRIHPFDVFNVPVWVPRLGRGRARRARDYFGQAMQDLIVRRLDAVARGEAIPDDLLSALIKASDPETGAGLSREEVSANLFTLIAAGHETTARSLAWTLYLLSQSPEWEERCMVEARNAPEDPAQWLDAMPNLTAVFEESMRLFPAVPHMSRIAGADDVVSGVPIKAGTLIIVAPWVLHRHRLLWKNPDEFQPERFLPGAREKIDRFAYLPFGAGPRVCIGQVFAMQEAIIVLASILRRVRLRLSGPPPQPVHRITLRPSPRLAMSVERLESV